MLTSILMRVRAWARRRCPCLLHSAIRIRLNSRYDSGTSRTDEHNCQQSQHGLELTGAIELSIPIPELELELQLVISNPPELELELVTLEFGTGIGRFGTGIEIGISHSGFKV